jgi:hypothetical protein
MAFCPNQFDRAVFESRTRRVEVPALSDFFDTDECEWEVRGLNSNELHKAMSAKATQASLENVLQAITDGGDQVEAVRNAIGLGKDTPGEMAKRLEMLVSGSIDPEMTLPQAVKLAENFPIEFLTLTNAITELTGMGSELVKPEAALLEISS